MAVDLRDYQLAAIHDISRALQRVRRVVLVAFVAFGKTITAAAIIMLGLRRGRRFLFIAHRKELLDQCYQKLLDCGVPESELSIIRASDPRFRRAAPVQIASMQTLRARHETLPADYVFIDESHHAPAASLQMILARYPDAKIIGLTATPVHGTRGLRGHFDDIVIGARPSELIAKGWIVAPDIYTVPEEMLPDVSKVKTAKDGDYNQRELAEACERPELVGHIVEHWKAHGRDAQTLCFAASVRESRMIEQQFKSQSIAAAHVDGQMPMPERDRIFAGLRSGLIRVVSNCDLAVEGFDAPMVKTLVMARPTQSLVVYIQQSGRVMRRYGEEPATILDHAGNVQRFGFPDDDIEWSLGDPPRRRVSVKRCPQCFAANESAARVCCNPRGDCGPPPYEWTAEQNEQIERDMVIAEGRLARAIRAVPTADPQMDAWVEYCREAISQEYDETWARARFKERFGVWPPDSAYRFPVRPQASWPDERRRKRLDQLYAAAHKVSPESPAEWVRKKYHTIFGEDVSDLQAREHEKIHGKRSDAQEEMTF